MSSTTSHEAARAGSSASGPPPARGADGHGGTFDVAVVGAGFGGLAAALSLAERGARVALLETLTYPGGCASTFARDGHRFESGATLFSGLDVGGLFGRWIERYGLDVEVEWPDPAIELRTPAWRLPLERRRAALVERLAALPGADRTKLERFFRFQREVADLLWSVLEDPARLPPFGAGGLLRNVASLPRAARLARLVGKPLADVVRRFGLEGFAPLRTLLDASCQITVQCTADEAEAPFALGALDYVHRGTGHVRDGIGALAEGLVEALRSHGACISFADRVRGLERMPGGGWRVASRRGELRARTVVANVLPHGLRALLGGEADALLRRREQSRVERDVERGWGACMLYLVARAPEDAPDEARHLQLVADPTRPPVEGNHVFCSISSPRDRGRTPDRDPRLRTITVSTHVRQDRLQAMDPETRAEYVRDVQDRMRATLAALAPEWELGVTRSMTASPRTFERFTGRRHGFVGGPPRRAGEVRYLALRPRPAAPGLYLVGDSVLMGQSTLATAFGGVKVADAIERRSRSTFGGPR